MDNDVQFLIDFQKITALENLTNSEFYSGDSSNEFHIIDIPPVCIVANAPLSLTIKNPNNNKIHLLAIDQGLVSSLSGYSGKRPEGVLLNKFDLCLIELKLNVTSNNEITQTERITDAIEKFDGFIFDIKRRFAALSKDFMALGFKRYEAYIVLPSSKYPRFSSSTTNRSVRFWIRHKITLKETNIKEF